MHELQERFPGRVVFYSGYSEELAHFIEAAADIFLMPSLYEPCGLNQMYSLKYGTVPDRAPHGRPRRQRAAFRSRRPARARASCSTTSTPAACAGRSQTALEWLRLAERVAPARAERHAAGFLAGMRSAAEYEALYDSLAVARES